MGAVLHEILHIFLDQFACRRCIIWENWDNHGRAWQRIAKAIEEQSLRLLGIDVNIGRLTALLCDKQKYGAESFCPSLHDLEAWSFWEPIKE
jgi:hypothetical protein